MRLSVNASVAAVFIAGSILLMFALATSFPAVRAIAMPPQPIGPPAVSVIGSPIGSAGTSFEVYGNGWPPNQIVFVYLGNLDRLDDRQVIFSGETDAQGSFVLRAPCTTDPHWSAMPAVAVIVQNRDQSIEVAYRVSTDPGEGGSNSVVVQSPVAVTDVPTPAPTDPVPTQTPVPSPTAAPPTPTTAPARLPAATFTATPLLPQTTFPDWKGEYFDNVSLSGQPMLVRNDKELKFPWGDGSPGQFIPADNFSTRWTRTINIGREDAYHFSLKVDDGARVYVDGNLVMERWSGASAAETYSQDVHLTAGSHELRVEMLEQGGQAFIEFSYAKVESYSGWKGEYFASRDPAGEPAMVRDDNMIHFDWGTGSPGEGIPADGFSVRWTRTINFEQDGEHVFKVDADDGVRLSVDGARLIDEWHDASQKTHEGRINLAAGWHTVVLEYYEHTGDARAMFVYEPPISGWKGKYFGNPDLSGMPMFVRDDGNANRFGLGWGYDSPGPGILIDRFSTRWTRRVNIDTEGRYRFSITADDGARFFIDNHLVLDEWRKSNSETYSFMADLNAGRYEFRIEYYEHDGRARIAFEDWTRVSDIPPTQAPFTSTPIATPILTPTP